MAISVFVICAGDILIQQRALSKYHTPGLWANTCCTHPNWQEPALDCANRRLDEELGLTGLALEHRGQVEYRAEVGNGLIEHELVDVFVTHANTRPIPSPNPNEVMDTDWLGYENLRTEIDAQPDRFTPWLRIYLDQFADRIFQSDFA